MKTLPAGHGSISRTTFVAQRSGQIDEILPWVKLLLAECVRYTINRVVYYYPPMLPPEMLAEKKDVKTGEIDANLWVAVEDLQDGWEKSGQVGQEVYGAGIAFGIVPRQYYKVKKAGFMIFTEYPCAGHRIQKDTVSFRLRGSARMTFRMVLLPIEKGRKLPSLTVRFGEGRQFAEANPIHTLKSGIEFGLPGDSKSSGSNFDVTFYPVNVSLWLSAISRFRMPFTIRPDASSAKSSPE